MRGEHVGPTKPQEELLVDLEEAIALVSAFLAERNASLENMANRVAVSAVRIASIPVTATIGS